MPMRECTPVLDYCRPARPMLRNVQPASAFVIPFSWGTGAGAATATSIVGLIQSVDPTAEVMMSLAVLLGMALLTVLLSLAAVGARCLLSRRRLLTVHSTRTCFWVGATSGAAFIVAFLVIQWIAWRFEWYLLALLALPLVAPIVGSVVLVRPVKLDSREQTQGA